MHFNPRRTENLESSARARRPARSEGWKSELNLAALGHTVEFNIPLSEYVLVDRLIVRPIKDSDRSDQEQFEIPDRSEPFIYGFPSHLSCNTWCDFPSQLTD